VKEARPAFAAGIRRTSGNAGPVRIEPRLTPYVAGDRIFAENRKKYVYPEHPPSASAVHQFGPIGAPVGEGPMRVCRVDLRAVARVIARQVDASSPDARAFFASIAAS